MTDAVLEPDVIRDALLDWERTYNTIRPRQALGYLTPAEYLASVGVNRTRILGQLPRLVDHAAPAARARA